jgi:heme O synthase-like polyprenyltransferase
MVHGHRKESLMKKQLIVLALLTVLCFSVTAPQEAEAVGALIALPIWAIGAGVFALAVGYDVSKDQQPEQVAATTETPTPNGSQPHLAKLEPDTVPAK